jgi:general L-amino acid transport system permease protein
MTTLPEEIELALQAEERAVERAPHKEPTSPGEWIRENLFASPLSGLLTIVGTALVVFFGYRLVRWVFVTAEWDVVKANVRVYMVGRFPVEELWRVWAGLYFVVALAGLSWGASGKRLRWTIPLTVARIALGGTLFLALLYLLEGVGIWIRIAVAVALFAAGVTGGRIAGERLRRVVWGGWLLAFPLVIILLRGFGGVRPGLWGGFLLNIIVAVVGIFVSFPIGLFLAVGRRSSLPAISAFCVGFIEFIRGVPLITLLLFGQFIVPLLLPIDVPAIIRAMIMFVVFSSAYVAEIVRGGLQGVHAGQYEAGRALGLSMTRLMALVVLPQALRNTIPAMISHFISLFKDTSLLAVIAGFSDLLRTARRASGALEFIGTQAQALGAAAFIFWAVAFSLSRWSQRVERRVGVGER